MLAHRLHGLAPVARFGHDRDVQFGAQDHPKTRPDESLIVGEDDADGHGDVVVNGNRARITKPPPGRTSVSSRP